MKELLSRKNTASGSTVSINFNFHDQGDNPATILWTCGYNTSTVFYQLFPEYRASQKIVLYKQKAK